MGIRELLGRKYKVLAMFAVTVAVLACVAAMAIAPGADAQIIVQPPVDPGGDGDTTRPRVSSIVRTDANPTKASSVDFKVNFSEDVTGVDSSDFRLTTTGTISGASISTGAGDFIHIGSTTNLEVNTGSGSGTIRLDLLNNGTIKDRAGNLLVQVGTYTSGESYTVDKTAPTATVNQATGQADPTGSQPIEYSVLFSEDVTGFDASDVALSGTATGKTASVSGSGSSYTLSVNGLTSSGTVKPTIAAGKASDLAGNTSAASTSTDNEVTYDGTAPTLSSIDDGDEDNIVSPGDTLTYTLTFSEDIDSSTLSSADFDNAGTAALSIGAIAETSPGVFSLKATPSASTTGTLILRVPSSASIKDAVGNGLVTPLQDADTMKVGGPAPMVSSIAFKGKSPIITPGGTEFLVTFTESVTGIDKTDFRLSTTGNVSGASIFFAGKLPGYNDVGVVQVITGTGSGTLRLDLIDNDSIKDSDQNPLGGPGGTTNGDFTSGESVTLDKEFPVTIEQASAQPDPASSQPVEFEVSFRPNETDQEWLSHEVVGFEASDVELSGTAEGGTVSVSGGSGGDYKVSVEGLTSDGTVRASIPAGAVLDYDYEQRPNEASTSIDNEVYYRANSAPAAVDDSYEVDEDGTLGVRASGVLSNDTDAEDDPLAASEVSGPGHGTLTLDSDGSFTYAPDEHYGGADSFTYKVNDGTDDSNVASVGIAVNAVNDEPTISAIADQSTDEDTPTGAIALSIGDEETAAGDLTLEGSSSDTALVPDSNVVLGGSGTDRTVVVTPAAHRSGTATITVSVTDAEGATVRESFTLEVGPVNDAPEAGDRSMATNEDVAKTVTLAASDVEGDALDYTIVEAPEHGTLSGSTGAGHTYTPTTDYYGTDTFTYKAYDGVADSNIATVTIAVGAVNDAPSVTVARGGSCGTGEREGTIDLTVSDVDDAAAGLTLDATSSNTALMPKSNVLFGGTGSGRTLKATAVSGKSGAAVLTVEASDGQASRTVPVKVRAGGDGNNALSGTSGADMIFGQKGNDTLSGLDANDLLCSGSGKDTLSGGKGGDTLFGGKGADSFSGGAGTDTAGDFSTAEGDTKDSTIP